MRGYFIFMGWIAGIATMGKMLSFPSGILVICLCLTALCLALAWWLKKNTFMRGLSTILLMFSGFLLGHFYVEHALNNRLKLREMQVEAVDVVVYIKKINTLTENSIRQPADVLNRQTKPIVQWWLYLSEEQAQQVQLGQYYRLSGEVRPAHSYANEGDFDQERWWIQENIQASLKVNALTPLSATAVKDLGFTLYVTQQEGLWASTRLNIEKLRLHFRQWILKQHLEQEGLLLALLTGDKSLLSEQQQEQFKLYGISHLLAISGPHVLIFALLMTFLCRCWVDRKYSQIYLKIPRPYVFIAPFILCVWLYALFVGFEIPALRTLTVVIISSIFVWMHRELHPFYILLVSASLSLWLDPFSILSAAFWLSYGACLILLRVYQTVQQQPEHEGHAVGLERWRTQLIHGTKMLIDSQWKIFLALLPLSILLFKQVSWFAPIANLMAIPIMGAIVVPLDVIAALVSCISTSLGGVILALAHLVLQILLFLLSTLANIFQPKLHDMAWTVMQTFCCAVGLFILFLPRGMLPKIWGLLCFVPLVFPRPSVENFQLTVLDVGQGQSVFVQMPQQTLLIDTGGYYQEDKFSIGEQVVLPFLLRQGVSSLNQVVLSHLDQDHSGGYLPLSKHLPMQNVYSSERDERFKNANFNYCYEGQVWHSPEASIKVLSPEQSQLAFAKDDPNEHSCVLYIQVHHAKKYQNFLIMGDAGWFTEYQLLQKYPDLKVDVLILGHHGSQHSSSYAFLQHFKPKLAVASAGFNNRYQHPHPMTLARLADLKIPVISTIDQGAIQFKVESEQQDTTVQGYRQKWQWLQRQALN